jgi:RNA polymerase sigma-B factor
MPGTSRHGPLADLDAAAVLHAQAWRLAGPAEREVLRADLICRCLPFADRMARRYSGRPEPLDDLRQVARLGLINAVDRYDPVRGSFTSFAMITMCGEIKRHFRDRTWGVHVSRRMQNLILEIDEAVAELTHTLARAPTTAEIAEEVGVDEEEVRHARTCAAGHTAIPLSTPLGESEPRALGDLVGGTDESMDLLPDRLAVAGLVRTLPERIQRIIAWRFYGNRTQAQIAEELGISQMHVSRLLRQALIWLRAAMLSDVPPPWTGQEEAHHRDSPRIDIRQLGTLVSVQVRGEIDRDDADRLRHRMHVAVSLAAPGRLLVDLTGVPLVDAAGAAALRDVFVQGALSDVEVRFTGLQPHVAVVLAVLGLPHTSRAPAGARAGGPRPR